MARPKYTLTQLAGGIIIPVVVVLIGAVGYFLLLPKYQALGAAKAGREQKQQELAGRQEQLQSVRKLAAELAEKKEKLALVDEAIPDAPRIPELLADLDYLAKQSGILITGLEVTTAATLANLPGGTELETVQKTETILGKTKKLGILQISLRLSGRYANLRTFLLNAEQNLRLMDADSLVFGQVDSDSKLQEFSLKIQTYYQKP